MKSKILFFFLGLCFWLFSQSSRIKNLNQGLSAFYQENFSISAEIFNRHLNQVDNQSFWARYYLGFSLYRLGLTEDAFTQWENIIALGSARGNDIRNRINQLYDLSLKEANLIPYSFIKIRQPDFIATQGSYNIPLGLHIYKDNFYFLEYKKGNFYQTGLNGGEVFLKNNNLENYFNTIRNPWDVLVTDQQFIISDFGNDKIFVFDKKVNLLKSIGKRGNKVGELLGPKGLSQDEQGNIFLVESGNSRVQVFNQQGESLLTFGQLGRSEGQFNQPNDIVYDKNRKRVYVLDNGNQRVQEFDGSGNYLSQWGKEFLKNPNQLMLYGNKMFILDEKQIYHYHLNSREYFPLLKDGNKLDDFFLSMVYDEKNNQFLVSNIKNNRIEIYGSLSDSYHNLKVFLEDLDLSHFPYVTVGVKVHNFYNQKISFLKEKNFKVYENNVRVFPTLLPQNQNKRIVLLLEKSLTAEKFEKKTKNFFNDLFSALEENDLVKLIHFGGEKGFDEKTPFNRLSFFTTQKAFENSQPYSTPRDFTLVPGINQAINSLLSYQGDKAVVLISYRPYSISAFGNNNRFKKFVYFFKNNGIPVYVFHLGSQSNFRSGNHHFLKELADGSEGKFWVYNSSQRLKELAQEIKEFSNNRYSLNYLTATNPRRKGILRNVKVEVSFLGKKGIEDLIVYPIPK